MSLGVSDCSSLRRMLVLQAVVKRPDARHPKFQGMRPTKKYAAMTRNEGNAADGLFPTAC
jgi:hypothetical protein